MFKILKGLMYNRLVKYIEQLNLMNSKQYGFGTGHSTNQAQIDVFDNIQKALDQNDVVIAVFMDLAKAFDTINHDILLYKHNHLGIHGHALNFFKSYISN